MLRALFFLTTILVLSVASVAEAQRRIALVVGMARYEYVPALKNTVNDAEKISQTLEDIGFDVTKLVDVSLRELKAGLDQFAFESETAELALIYFAGHGVEVEGENFLVPIDAKVRSTDDVAEKSVSLRDMLRAVDRARKMRIVILDSCRDNPFGEGLSASSAGGVNAVGGGQGGLAPPSPDRGTLVAFAARDGEVALDGDGENSPFATALAETMQTPNLEISLMFRRVRDKVLRATDNLQEPNTYGSLSGIPFYLAGRADIAEATFGEDGGVVSAEAAWSATRPDTVRSISAVVSAGSVEEDPRMALGYAYIKMNAANRETYDPVGAVEILEALSQIDYAEAQHFLATLYETGRGVPQDHARALELFQASSSQDFADAINDLGFLHYQGALGLTRDPETALALFARAADLRHPQAMYNYAALIDDGLVASKSAEDSAHYLYLALRSGSQDVLNILLENPASFKVETRRALQAKLSEFDFYEGAIDGDIGPGTQRGIRLAYGLKE